MSKVTFVSGLVRFCLLALFAPIMSRTTPLNAQDLDEMVALCTSCHGEDGRPIEPDITIVWGQQYYYLYVQLKNYKSGLRANEVMNGISGDLSKDQMKEPGLTPMGGPTPMRESGADAGPAGPAGA